MKTHTTRVNSKIGRGWINAYTDCGIFISTEIKLKKMSSGFDTPTCKKCLEV